LRDVFFIYSGHILYGVKFMTMRRLVVAAAAMLLAVYLKLSMPVFSERIVPALKDMLCEEQVVIVVPIEAAAWTGLG